MKSQPVAIRWSLSANASNDVLHGDPQGGPQAGGELGLVGTAEGEDGSDHW